MSDNPQPPQYPVYSGPPPSSNAPAPIPPAYPRATGPAQPYYGYGQPAYSQPQYSQQPLYVSQPAVAMAVVQPERPITPKQHTVFVYARGIRWMAIADCFIVLIYILILFFWLLILLPLPILGYYAGYYLNRGLAVAYLVFEVLMIALRVVFMILFPNIVFIVLSSIAIVFEVIIIGFIVRFIILVGELSPEELEDTKALIQERPRPAQSQSYQYL